MANENLPRLRITNPDGMPWSTRVFLDDYEVRGLTSIEVAWCPNLTTATFRIAAMNVSIDSKTVVMLQAAAKGKDFSVDAPWSDEEEETDEARDGAPA